MKHTKATAAKRMLQRNHRPPEMKFFKGQLRSTLGGELLQTPGGEKRLLVASSKFAVSRIEAFFEALNFHGVDPLAPVPQRNPNARSPSRAEARRPPY
jgi:hypothetical protein